MRFIQIFRMRRSWNWRLIFFHLMVCAVYRVRPCPLYRVISWLSKHIHFIQASGKVSLWDPLFFHSPPFFCVSLFWQPCWGLYSNVRLPPFLPSFLSLSHFFSPLSPLWTGGGAGGGMFLFVFDFWDSQEIGYKLLMLRSEGAKKNNAFFVVCTHRLQHPNVPMYVCSKVIQVGAGSAKREMSVLKSAHLCIALHAELFRITTMGPAAFSWCWQTTRPHWRGYQTTPTEQTSP